MCISIRLNMGLTLRALQLPIGGKEQHTREGVLFPRGTAATHSAHLTPVATVDLPIPQLRVGLMDSAYQRAVKAGSRKGRKGGQRSEQVMLDSSP